MSKHTSGPWHVCDGCTHLIADNHHMTVAEARQIVSGNLRTGKTEYVPGHQMQLANAKLIAAAPDMYDALRAMLDVFGECDTDPQAESAIRQAVEACRKVDPESNYAR